MSEFQKAMRHILDYRGGKLRVPGLESHGYTYWVTEEVWDDALAQGYIDADGAVTAKFREEYDQMFDKVGRIRQTRS